MAKKKKKTAPVKIEFTRGYSGPEGIYLKGNTDVVSPEVAEELIALKVAKVYVAPPVIPAETATPPADPSAPKVSGD